MGIAVADGTLAGVDEPVLAYFSDYDLANVNARKSAMTIQLLIALIEDFIVPAV